MVIKYLALSAKHAKLFDTMQDHKLTSPLVNATEYKKNGFSKNYSETECELTLKSLSWKEFDFCRDDMRFENLSEDIKLKS